MFPTRSEEIGRIKMLMTPVFKEASEPTSVARIRRTRPECLAFSIRRSLLPSIHRRGRKISKRIGW